MMQWIAGFRRILILSFIFFQAQAFAQSNAQRDPASQPVASFSYDSPQAIAQAYEYAQNLENSGRHYSAAAIFFNIYTVEGKLQDAALGRLTECLIRGGL